MKRQAVVSWVAAAVVGLATIGAAPFAAAAEVRLPTGDPVWPGGGGGIVIDPDDLSPPQYEPGGGTPPGGEPANAAPTAADDAYRARPGKMLERSAAKGVLANDADADGDALTARLLAKPDKGRLTLAADGSFTYEAKKSARGTDTFTYEVSDGRGGTATATVTITLKK